LFAWHVLCSTAAAGSDPSLSLLTVRHVTTSPSTLRHYIIVYSEFVAISFSHYVPVD